jgi:protein phosphatase
MKIQSICQTDIGLVRKQNQDRLGLFPESDLYIVADGMGGRPAGEIASQMTVDAIVEFILNRKNKTPSTKLERRKRRGQLHQERRVGASEFEDAAALHEGIVHANQVVLNDMVKNPTRRGMGTTVVALLARPHEVVIGFLGDSRAYLHRAGTLTPLTQDHSVVNEYIREGILTLEAALVHPFRHVVSRGIGIEAKANPDTVQQSAEEGDLFLLCTDGLTNMLNDDQINSVLNEANGSLPLAASALIEKAKAAGGKDNITVILIQYEKQD